MASAFPPGASAGQAFQPEVAVSSLTEGTAVRRRSSPRCSAAEGIETPASAAGAFHFQAGDALTAGVVDRRVFFQDYMQDHIVARGLPGGTVLQPVGSFEVHLHIACPEGIANADAGVEEVRGVGVVRSGMEDFDGLAGGGFAGGEVKALQAPGVVQ